jgi:hypothetical protein
MSKSYRFKVLVDGRLQGALLGRVLFYWCLCVAGILLLAGIQAAWTGQQADWPVVINRVLLGFGPALIASVALLPLVLFDALRFSHRFAGPLTRLTKDAARLADGEDVPPVVFRKGDFWREYAMQFNRVAEEVRRLKAQVRRLESQREVEASDAADEPQLVEEEA